MFVVGFCCRYFWSCCFVVFGVGNGVVGVVITNDCGLSLSSMLFCA